MGNRKKKKIYPNSRLEVCGVECMVLVQPIHVHVHNRVLSALVYENVLQMMRQRNNIPRVRRRDTFSAQYHTKYYYSFLSILTV